MFRCISGDKLPLLVISAVSGSYREADVGTARVGRRKEGKREEVGSNWRPFASAKRETWTFASTSRELLARAKAAGLKSVVLRQCPGHG
jgi:hypothetical protein